jgi:dienelactone hydrolase
VVQVLEDGLSGIFLSPAGQGTHPGVLVLSGSNGGVPIRPAEWLASHGYAVLALAYFHYEDLPPLMEAIPLEYFERALAWMAKRPEIASQRIAAMGTSRGGELALQLGSMFPQIRAVVAYVPADVRFPPAAAPPASRMRGPGKAGRSLTCLCVLRAHWSWRCGRPSKWKGRTVLC